MAKGNWVLSNWHTLFEDFSTSTQAFYTAVEEAVARRNLPEVKFSRVLFSEGGIGSPAREYLRISRRRVAFDICSAPYGNGHFFSWWLAKIPARFGLLIVAAIVVALIVAVGILQAIVLQVFGSCFGGGLAILLLFVGVPAGLVYLGYLVEQGKLGDEEWVLSVPVIGYLYTLFFNPTTYYRLDTAMMFRDSIRAAVNEVISDVRQEKGLRLLSDEELRPDVGGPGDRWIG